MCAVQAGKSVASTMGFTAVDGLPMGTRCGSIDPGRDPLSHGSARYGRTRDREADLQPIRTARRVRDLERHARRCSRATSRARSSRSTFTSIASVASLARLPRRSVDSMRSCLPPASARTRPIRERVCRDAAWLGVELDAAANASGGPCISARQRGISAWAIPTNEELMIARHTRALLDAV